MGTLQGAQDVMQQPMIGSIDRTYECRRRIEETMAADDIGDNRIKAAREG